MLVKNIKRFSKKISPLKSITFDCEGILTRNERKLTPPYDQEPLDLQDREALQHLKKSGFFILSVITRSRSTTLYTYLLKQGFDHVYMAADDKLQPYDELKKIYDLTDLECCHIGDGDADLPLIERVGFSVTVPHADSVLKKHADYCTQQEGGSGAVAELCNLLINSKTGNIS